VEHVVKSHHPQVLPLTLALQIYGCFRLTGIAHQQQSPDGICDVATQSGLSGRTFIVQL
jgi:hypothetical protein